MTVSYFICTPYPRCVHTLFNVFYPIRGWQRYGDILFSAKFYPRPFYVILLDYPRSAYSFRSFQRIITKNQLNIQSLLAHSVRSISKLHEINRISQQSTKCLLCKAKIRWTLGVFWRWFEFIFTVELFFR